ncbi:glutamyl-tRNA reductase [Leptospira ryugenii]|uniref:Glutamyl-tRNA reductase n=1 Tax=Leptospira ryugenii TaxID=1917863 RepID=A0A2P2DXV1_9LEPT|nr:glutamyl-tRNA reductase [Leptospira ryugenii]
MPESEVVDSLMNKLEKNEDAVNVKLEYQEPEFQFFLSILGQSLIFKRCILITAERVKSIERQ